MRKITLLSLLLITFAAEISAQQLPQFSQYLLNDYAVNPAVAGSRDALEIRSNNRLQWTGIQDAPRTYTLSFSDPIANGKMGIGAYLFTDVVGPTRRIGLQGSYAYHFKATDELNIGIALSVGLLEYTIDGDKIRLEEENDPARINTLGRSRVFDSKAGVYVHTDKLFIGFSIPQFFQSNLNLYDVDEPKSRIETHYFAYAGYKLDVSENIMIEPSFMVKSVVPTPAAIDLSLRAFYQQKIWIGSSFRMNDAVVAMLGYKWEDRIVFAYSYDLSMSDITGYSGGTHELMIGLDLSKLKE